MVLAKALSFLLDFFAGPKWPTYCFQVRPGTLQLLRRSHGKALTASRPGGLLCSAPPSVGSRAIANETHEVSVSSRLVRLEVLQAVNKDGHSDPAQMAVVVLQHTVHRLFSHWPGAKG